jgi:DNA polymerase IV
VERPLTALFIDCDSFFASVEQYLDPKLRGRPVGVAPVMAETSCCIAASYEAKAFGVKTGTRICDARIMCPGIAIVESKPPEYIKVHHRIIEAVEDCIHVEAVLSIDEMWAWLPYNWREPAFVIELGQKIKSTVAREVSPFVKVSIGAAPNKYLAKLASKMRKPDGLFIIEGKDLPEILFENQLRDFNGVGSRMEMRLHASGIHTTADLCYADKPALRSVWGGVLGDRLWHLLRGDEIPDLVSVQKSIGHSHVLAPIRRHPDEAWAVIAKLTHKACERLRASGKLTASLTMQLAYFRGVAWGPEIRFPVTDSTLSVMTALKRLWQERPEPRSPILQVGIVLNRLCDRENYTPELFQTTVTHPATETLADKVASIMAATDEKHHRLDTTLDKLRTRYGRSVVYFGNVHAARDTAPMRISFSHIPNPNLEKS